MSIFSSAMKFLKSDKGKTGIGTALGGLGIGLELYNMYQSNKYAKENLDLQKDSLGYQKFLNANQQQIQASDAQSAGINPLALNGNSLTAGSASNVEAPSANSGIIGDFIMNSINNKFQEKLLDKQISSSEAMRQADNESKERVAQLQADTQRYIADSNRNESARQADNLLEHLKYVANANFDNETKRLELQKSIADVDKALKDSQSKLNDAELRERCYSIANSMLSGVGKGGHLSDIIRSTMSAFWTFASPILRDDSLNANSLASKLYEYYRSGGHDE